MIQVPNIQSVLCLMSMLHALCGVAAACEDDGQTPVATTEAIAPGNEPTHPTLEELKVIGVRRSSYRQSDPRSAGSRVPDATGTEAPKPRLVAFQAYAKPVLERACVHCHGPDTQEGNIRIDTLDPDLLHGDDVNWWLEVLAVLSKDEMPPADAEKLADEDRRKVVEWLSSEIQAASTVRRAAQGHSSFRRMTRYEYNYALQDLLGLPYDFAKDLPPDPASEDGFQNSSEMLQMSAIQFAAYRQAGRQALHRATVRGRQPAPLYWDVSMQAASAREFARQDEELDKIRQKHKGDPDKLKQEVEKYNARLKSRPNGAHYKQFSTGRTARVTWRYNGARYAWKPSSELVEPGGGIDHVAIIPPNQKLIVELGDQIPEEGTLRVRIRASQVSNKSNRVPSLQLEFGWQASNDSQASVRISHHDVTISASPENPQFYQWDIPLSDIYPRNSVRKISKMGDLPSPSEYIKFVNSSVSSGDIQIDYVTIEAPVYGQWPPPSHNRIFIESEHKADELVYAREVLTNFMSRAWRRPVTAAEIDQKLDLFGRIRPRCADFQESVIEVLATVLSSPKFLYLVRSETKGSNQTKTANRISDYELATRLAMFLWCSIPDDELRELATEGRLSDSEVLSGQVRRMLADSRSRRFSEHFVRQWLGMQLLDFLNVDRKVYPQFNASLKEAMQEEPIAFFQEMLQNNRSVLDFIHADYVMVNERLARHYELNDVYGNDFRNVKLKPNHRRGGLLTQAGLLAMNSDGTDSHPLKRGMWMLESLLNDPPPPPPPAVPEIDLADPEIARLTLKERIADHRNHSACMSCHSKIDPWGIAFENFDAVGDWRTQVRGKPVDASSTLFNGQQLDGMDGLKRFLLEYRQDQFVRATVYKMVTYALGRPLTFGDHSSLDQITADLRSQDDGLVTMITLITSSALFRSQ